MNNKPAIIFVIALKQEIPDSLAFIPTTTIKALLANDTRNMNDSPYYCIISGVGKKNALTTMQWILKYMCPDIIINIGCCGTTKQDYLHTLICPQTIFHNNDHYHTIGTFPFFKQKNCRINIVPSLESIQEENHQPNHHLIDMESFWIAKSCHEKNIPFCCLKYVTDDNKANKSISVTEQLPLLRKAFNNIFIPIFTQEQISVSVIIPTFNRESTIIRAIQSVLNQSIQTEIIVIDDGSTDKTQQLIKPYLKQLNLITLTNNTGVSFARNKGIEAATGNWVMFLDSDDEWKPKKVEAQIRYIERHPHLSICQSQEQWVRYGKPVNKKKHHTKQQGYIWNYCLERCLIAPSSVMIKKVIFKVFGLFDTTLPVCEDYDLWLRLSRHLLIGLEPSESLIKYGGHSDQLSFSYDIMDQYRIHACKRLLQNEMHPIFQKKLMSHINKLNTIITNGAKKRNINNI